MLLPLNKKILALVMILSLPACGKHTVDEGATNASAAISSTTTFTPANFANQCSASGGSLITSNNTELCLYDSAAISLPYSFNFSLQFFSSTQWYTTSLFVSPGDTLKLTNNGSAQAYGSVGGYISFPLTSGNFASLRNEAGYFTVGVTVPAGFSSASMNITGLKVQRCINANNTAVQCP